MSDTNHVFTNHSPFPGPLNIPFRAELIIQPTATNPLGEAMTYNVAGRAEGSGAESFMRLAAALRQMADEVVAYVREELDPMNNQHCDVCDSFGFRGKDPQHPTVQCHKCNVLEHEWRVTYEC